MARKAMVAWLWMLALPVHAAAPQIDASALAVAPTIDGDVLGDQAWPPAAATDRFWQTQPDNGQPSTQRTEIRIGYTDDALYIGVVAYDDEPERIVVTDSRRDADLDNTDAVIVIIDGLLDRQNGFVFGTNPVGAEYDGQVTREGAGGFLGSGGGGFNRNWDGTWSVQ